MIKLLFLLMFYFASFVANSKIIPIKQTNTGKAIVLPDGILLMDEYSIKEYKFPKLKIEIHKPILIGKPDSLVEAFNETVSRTVLSPIKQFQKELIEEAEKEGISELAVSYEIFAANNKIISVRFEFFYTRSTAAHPWETYSVVNFELATESNIDLSVLFLPNRPYLNLLSNISAKELTKQEFPVSDVEGLKPKKENFRNWNMDEKGIYIFFEPYQIAPRVSGAAEVMIPYKDLNDVLTNLPE